MTWKLNEDGTIEMKDGNPVYVGKDGKEMVVAVDTITRLNGEAKEHREAKQAALEKLKAFEGIDDPVAARKALETVSKLDAKQLIDAGKVDEVKNQITQQFQSQLSEKEKVINELSSRYDNMVINNLFAGSEFLRNNVAVPRDMFEATFRNNFKIEDGKVVSYDKDGNRLYSKERAGEYADPDEALKLLVEMHPQKDVILKADVGSGTGNKGAGGAHGGSRVMKRSEADTLAATNPVKFAEQMKLVREGQIKLVD